MAGLDSMADLKPEDLYDQLAERIPFKQVYFTGIIRDPKEENVKVMVILQILWILLKVLGIEAWDNEHRPKDRIYDSPKNASNKVKILQ